MAWTKTLISGIDFVADWNSIDRNTGRQIDWDSVGAAFNSGGYPVTASGVAAASATAVPVQALAVALPVGTTLLFGGTKAATLTAAAAAGATSLAVAALAAGIASGDVAYYTPVGSMSRKMVRSGTVMSQLASGKICPRASRPGSEVAIGLLYGTAQQGEPAHAVSGYGVIIGGVIYDNLLPEGVPIAGVKTELDAAGTKFNWQTYLDSSEV